MKDRVLELNELVIGYGNKAVCSGINANADTGSLVLLVGANGMGKSTLLKTIANHVSLIGGEIFISGNSITETGINELSRELSYLPSVTSVPAEVSVIDLLSFSRIPYKKWYQSTSVSDRLLIDSVVKKLEIQNLLKQSYMTLSDGQKQVVNIARSMVQETSLVLLDEPTAHLDIVNKRKIFKLLKELTSEGKTVICSTHDLYDAFDFADEFWIIDKAKKWQKIVSQENLSIEDIKKMLF